MLYSQRIKRLVFVSLAIVITSSMPVSAKKLSLENDGTPRDNVDDCYGQSKEIPPTYEGVSYYDCYVPYLETPDSVGGWWESAIGDYGGTSPAQIQEGGPASYVRLINLGNWTSQEGDQGTSIVHENGKVVNKEGTLLTLEANNGLDYYVFAPPEYLYANVENYVKKPKQQPYYGWSINNRGQLVDVVLTSGDVVHFTVGDANASEHSNGPVKREQWSGSNAAKSKLKLENYAHIYNGSSGNILELWVTSGGSSSFFKEKFGISSDKNSTHIAFIRMYNAKLSDNVTISDVAKNAKDKSFFHLDVEGGNNKNGGNTGSDEVSTEKKDDIGISQGNIVDEWDLHGMPDKSKISDDQNVVDIPTGLDNVSDQINANSIKENMKARQREVVRYWTNVFVTALGLMLLEYTVLLVVAWLTDRVNNIFDFSLITLITFGVVKPTREEAKEGSTISLPRLIMICSATFLGAIFLISGGVFDVVQYILNWITGLF